MKYFLAILLLIVLVAGGAAAWLWYGVTKPYQDFAKEGVFVDVPRGASSRHVANLLKTNGVVRSAMAFEIYARRHPKRTLQAGEYFFDHAMTGREVFWKLANGLVYQGRLVDRHVMNNGDRVHVAPTAVLQYVAS